MKIDKEFNRMFRQEFPELAANIILKNDQGEYEVFTHYRIVPASPGYRVYCAANDIGLFNTTRTALSWCIADKYKHYNLARDILELDSKLGSLTADIAVRASLADRSTRIEFRDQVSSKLETKFIRKKIVENQLAKCVNSAKYCQQRGFNNETVRTGRQPSNKTSR